MLEKGGDSLVQIFNLEIHGWLSVVLFVVGIEIFFFIHIHSSGNHQ